MKKVIKYLSYIAIFVVILIGSFVFFMKNKKYDIIDAYNSLEKINKANINIRLSQKIDNSSNNIVLFYKYNYQKDFNDNNYKNASIASGTFAVEDEELQSGIYIPLQIVKTKNNIDIFATLEEEYNFINFPNNQIYLSLNSLLSELEQSFTSEDLYKIQNDLYSIFKEYFRNNKDSYRFLKYKDNSLLNGMTGAFIYDLQEKDFDELLDLINTKIDKKLLDIIPINKFLVENKIFLLTSTLRIDIYKNYVSSISVGNNQKELIIEILNINNKNNIKSINKEESLDLVEYIDNIPFNIDDYLFGESENIIYYLDERFNELVIYMTSVLEYSDGGEFDKAEVSLNYINDIINEMEKQEVSSQDKEVFYNYLNLFKALEKYIILYKQSYENPKASYDDILSNIVQDIADISKTLGIELNIPK